MEKPICPTCDRPKCDEESRWGDPVCWADTERGAREIYGAVDDCARHRINWRQRALRAEALLNSLLKERQR